MPVLLLTLVSKVQFSETFDSQCHLTGFGSGDNSMVKIHVQVYFHVAEYGSAAGVERVQNDLREAQAPLEAKWDIFFGQTLWLSVLFTAAASPSLSRASFPCQLQAACSESLCSSPALIALSPGEFFQSLLQRELSVLRYRAFCAKHGSNKESKFHLET